MTVPVFHNRIITGFANVFIGIVWRNKSLHLYIYIYIFIEEHPIPMVISDKSSKTFTSALYYQNIRLILLLCGASVLCPFEIE